MILTTRCLSCKADIKIKSSAKTRPDLQMEKGDTFELICQACGHKQTVHVNDVVAEVNNIIIMIGVIIGLLATSVLWFMFGAIGALSIIIPILFWQQQMASVRAFNSYKIRRK